MIYGRKPTDIGSRYSEARMQLPYKSVRQVKDTSYGNPIYRAQSTSPISSLIVVVESSGKNNDARVGLNFPI